MTVIGFTSGAHIPLCRGTLERLYYITKLSGFQLKIILNCVGR